MSDVHDCDYPETCQVCNPRVRKAPETVDYTFNARYHTECQKCDGAIFPGELIARMTTGRILCGGCTGIPPELSFK